MPKKKKKGLLSDDKARVGYQEGADVTENDTEETILVDLEFTPEQITEIMKMVDEERNEIIKARKEEILENEKRAAEIALEAGTKLHDEDLRNQKQGGGLLSDDKARMAYAEGEEVAAEDEDMEGVAISISPVTATKEDIEQAETADTDEMVSDNEMEQDHLDFIIDNALDKEDEAYLMEVLQADSRLSMIFDRVMDTASEFSGDGPVEGLGSEVSDSIPARLSDGEFVMTAKAADEIGPDNLQNMMDEAEEVSDNRQQAAQGGEIEDDKPIVSEFGKPVDEDIAEDEIKKGMLSVNPRLQ
jgi:hypothetical protein